MGHYKSNIRDLEFNLFEVFNRGELFGTGPFAEIDEDTAHAILDEVAKLAEGPIAASFTDADRHPPVFDPATSSVTMPKSFVESYNAWVDAEWWRLELQPELGGTPGPRSLELGHRRDGAGRQPGRVDVRVRAPVRPRAPHPGQRRPEEVRPAGRRPPLGLHDGADRARRGLRRRRRPQQGDPAARRHLAHRGRQALHHQRRTRHGGEHLPPGAGPPRGPRSRHQGPVAVPGAQVPGRPGDGRAQGAQRRLRHQRREEDGPQGLHDLRAHLRRQAPGRSATWSATATRASSRCSR